MKTPVIHNFIEFMSLSFMTSVCLVLEAATAALSSIALQWRVLYIYMYVLSVVLLMLFSVVVVVTVH